MNTTIPFSIATSSVTLPFQVFSQSKGSSLWKEQPLPLDQGIYASFNAALDASGTSLTPEQATAQAYAYAQAWVAASPASALASPQRMAGPSVEITGDRDGTGVHSTSVRSLSPRLQASEGQCTSEGTNCITAVQNLGDEIMVSYLDARHCSLSSTPRRRRSRLSPSYWAPSPPTPASTLTQPRTRMASSIPATRQL